MEEEVQKKQTLTFLGEASNLQDVRACVEKFLADSRLSETECARIVMAVDEACTNIIRHAHGGEIKPVRLKMLRLQDRLRFVLHDQGPPIALDKIPTGQLTHSAHGGMGVFIIREVFDQVEYTPETSGTRLTLEKNLPTHPYQSAS